MCCSSVGFICSLSLGGTLDSFATLGWICNVIHSKSLYNIYTTLKTQILHGNYKNLSGFFFCDSVELESSSWSLSLSFFQQKKTSAHTGVRITASLLKVLYWLSSLHFNQNWALCFKRGTMTFTLRDCNLTVQQHITGVHTVFTVFTITWTSPLFS